MWYSDSPDSKHVCALAGMTHADICLKRGNCFSPLLGAGWMKRLSSPVADLLRAATLVNRRLSCGVFPVTHTLAHTCTNIHVCTTTPPSYPLLLNTRFIERKCIITALPSAPHKAAHIKSCLSLMFQQVISGITAKPCSCYLALGVEIVEIFVVNQHSHLNPAKKLVNSAFVFQLCFTLHQQHRRRGGSGSREKVKGAFWAGFLRKQSSRGGIVCDCARVFPQPGSWCKSGAPQPNVLHR